MTFKLPVPDGKDFGLPRNRQQNLTHRIQLYSLFRQDAVTKRFVRISDEAYTPQLACRVFAERLSKAPLSLSIRPINIKSDKAEGITKHRRVNYIELRDGGSPAISSEEQFFINSHRSE